MSRNEDFKDAQFLPANYGEPPPNITADDEVYLVDFSYKRDVMEAIIAMAHEVTVIDHHKTAEAELRGLQDCHLIFDMEKCGSRLVWEYLTAAKPRAAPWIVDYVEDRDLWKWQLPNSREVSAALASYPFDFDVWDELAGKASGELAAEGRSILRYQQQVKDTHVLKPVEIDGPGGHKVLAVNATTLFSEVAGELAKGRPYGVAWFRRADGKYQFSLRSVSDGVDVSAIAKLMGGGGHKHAAGFEIESLWF